MAQRLGILAISALHDCVICCHYCEVIRQLRESDGALFKQLDKNRDGHLIRSEIPERFRGKIFDRFDVDGDGHVSPQEWEAVQSAAKQERD